jgi:recombinational DNA repair protein RecT
MADYKKAEKQVNVERISAIRLALRKEGFLSTLEKSLVGYGISTELYMNGVNVYIRANEKDVSQFSEDSVLKAILDGAAQGLRFDPALRQVIISGFSGVASAMVCVRGYAEMMHRVGIRLYCGVIREHDEYDYAQGDAPFIKIKPSLDKEGDVIAAYAIGKYADGTPTRLILLSRSDLNKLKAQSPVKGLWDKHEEAMKEACAAKRLGRVTAGLAEIISNLDDDYDNTLDAETPSPEEEKAEHTTKKSSSMEKLKEAIAPEKPAPKVEDDSIKGKIIAALKAITTQEQLDEAASKYRSVIGGYKTSDIAAFNELCQAVQDAKDRIAVPHDTETGEVIEDMPPAPPLEAYEGDTEVFSKLDDSVEILLRGHSTLPDGMTSLGVIRASRAGNPVTKEIDLGFNDDSAEQDGDLF